VTVEMIDAIRRETP